MLYPLLWGGHSYTVHRSTSFRICVFSPLLYFNWPHLPALHCTLNRDYEMISHQLPLLMSPRRSRPLLPMIMFQGQWHAPIEPLPKLPWQLFSHWAGYLTLSRWWCDKCHNYVNSVQSHCFFFSNYTSLAEQLSDWCFQLLNCVANSLCMFLIFVIFFSQFLNVVRKWKYLIWHAVLVHQSEYL